MVWEDKLDGSASAKYCRKIKPEISQRFMASTRDQTKLQLLEQAYLALQQLDSFNF